MKEKHFENSLDHKGKKINLAKIENKHLLVKGEKGSYEALFVIPDELNAETRKEFFIDIAKHNWGSDFKNKQYALTTIETFLDKEKEQQEKKKLLKEKVKEQEEEEVVPTLDKSKDVLELLKNEDLLQIIVKEIQKKAVGEEKAVITLLVFIALSKVENKKPTSSNVCANARSGAGKDYLTDIILSLVPSNFVHSKRRISEKALDYLLAQNEKRDWNLYIIKLEDVSDKILNSESIKTLMSARQDRYNEVEIVDAGKPKKLKIFGKPTLIFTTAKAKPKEETMRRLPFLYLDESPEQTLKINQMQLLEAETGERDQFEKVFFRFYNGLEYVNVKIPFAQDLNIISEGWINENPRFQVMLRTILPRFLDYIKGSACLFQHQREYDENFLLASSKDYDIARECLKATTSNKLMIPLNRDMKELYETLSAEFPEGESVAEINMKFNKWEERWLRNNLDKLVDLGFVKKESIHNEDSKKPVAHYIPITGVLEFDIPSWNELQELKKNNKNNAINTIKTKQTTKTNNTNNNNCINCSPVLSIKSSKKSKIEEKVPEYGTEIVPEVEVYE